MHTKKSIKDVQLKNKRIFLRLDLNVPLKNKSVLCTHKIDSVLPTINYILENEPKKLIIGTHLGRPNGYSEDLSVKPVVELINKKCKTNFVLRNLDSDLNDKFIFLENLRFYKEEKEGYNDFFKKNADLTVIDSFGCVHRNDKSVTNTLLPTVMGLLMEKELDLIKSIQNGVDLTIFGGAKISDKLKLISGIKSKSVWLVGALATTVLKSKGVKVGKSKCENLNLTNEFKEINLKLPKDFLVEDNQNFKYTTEICDNESVIDIGKESINEIVKDIKESKSVFWNGPAGIFEKKEAEEGTKSIAQALIQLVKQGGKVYVGGGETAMAALQFGELNDYTHVSTGGGALMTLLSGENMPGIDAIDNK
ncbi:phosphoglycerate kinase [Tubulinosema ratisbonensis]|uniref:Phosphoglycerate kinase n=1 Tax=Tubulinosema ratisbonensis TaxID=291195 RepID=A0A437AP94_9MICR|nr:phosphoglycerate kinase [Tubulinosema ratisbonensis]